MVPGTSDARCTSLEGRVDMPVGYAEPSVVMEYQGSLWKNDENQNTISV